MRSVVAKSRSSLSQLPPTPHASPRSRRAVPAGGRGSPGAAAAARPGPAAGGEPGSRRGPRPPARADVRKLSGRPWPERAPGAARRGGGTGGSIPGGSIPGRYAGPRAGQPAPRRAGGRTPGHGGGHGGLAERLLIAAAERCPGLRRPAPPSARNLAGAGAGAARLSRGSRSPAWPWRCRGVRAPRSGAARSGCSQPGTRTDPGVSDTRAGLGEFQVAANNELPLIRGWGFCPL